MKFSKILLSVGVAFVFSIATHAQKAEIKWDKWGVPHVIAKDEIALMHAFGWAQMKAHAHMILRLYSESRGRAAEYWGKSKLTNDRLVRSLNIPQRAKDWLQAQNTPQKERIKAFVAGMNAYAQQNLVKIDQKYHQVLPIQPEDPLAFLQTSYYLKVAAFALQPQAAQWKNAGSNAWAIAPKKSKSGKAMLLIQPHPPWFDYYMFTEAHLKAPGLNMYGIAPIGSPTIVMGFNENLGWAYTFNQADAMDLYELNCKNDQYQYDNTWKSFETRTEVIKVKNSQKTRGQIDFTYDTIKVRKSIHGYVIKEKGSKKLALRISGLEDAPFMIEQHWQMAKAENRKSFENAVSRLQLPLQNMIYADRHGEIFYLYNGKIPQRKINNYGYWQKVQQGNDPKNRVTKYLSYEQLPKYSNPASGFITNSNDPPWTTTFPQGLKPNDYPAYVAPQFMDYRAQRSVRMLQSAKKISFDELVKLQQATHSEVADRFLGELLNYLKKQPEPILKEAYQVLKDWDKQMRPESKGAVLFTNWFFRIRKKGLQKRWSPQQPLTTPAQLKPSALKAFKGVAQKVQKIYGKLNVAWGEVYRIQYGNKNVPANVGLNELGAFNAGFFRPGPKNQWFLLGGCSFIGAVEFGKRIKAKGLLTYGNATQTKSPHFGDQLGHFSQGKLRDIYFYEKDIQAHTIATKKFD